MIMRRFDLKSCSWNLKHLYDINIYTKNQNYRVHLEAETIGNPSAILSEKRENGSEVGGAGGCCPTPDCCAMRAERLGGTLGVPSTESSEPEVELLALSLSSPPSLSTISPSSRTS